MSLIHWSKCVAVDVKLLDSVNVAAAVVSHIIMLVCIMVVSSIRCWLRHSVSVATLQHTLVLVRSRSTRCLVRRTSASVKTRAGNSLQNR